MTKKTVALWLLVLFLALLGIGTINNQLRINQANARLEAQARAGQAALNRQCALVPAGRKQWADAFRRGVISDAEFDLYVSTAAAVCPAP